MNIVFFCQSCGARFEVAPSFAGKHGRCRQCGEKMTIPARGAAASVAAAPATAPLALKPNTNKPDAVRPSKPTPAKSTRTEHAQQPSVPHPVSWIEAVNTRVGLAPLTVSSIPIIKKTSGPDPYADATNSALYAVAESRGRLNALGKPVKQVSDVDVFWKQSLGALRKFLIGLNDYAYLISLPFLFLIVVGALSGNRGIAVLGATLVVLLNIGRFGLALSDLVVVPFRDSIVQGILFLIPPITLVYLANHWKKMRKPLKRIVEPAVTIGLVVLAFTFIPALGGSKKSGSLSDQIRSTAKGLTKEIKGEVERAKNLNVDDLEQEARGKLKSFEDGGGDAASPKADRKASKKGSSKGGQAGKEADPLGAGLDSLKKIGEELKELRKE